MLAIVFCQMLAKSAEATFFFANCEFDLLIEIFDRIEIARPKQFKRKSGYLREVPEYIFDVRPQTHIFVTLIHFIRFVAAVVCRGNCQSAPNRRRVTGAVRKTRPWRQDACKLRRFAQGLVLRPRPADFARFDSSRKFVFYFLIDQSEN